MITTSYLDAFGLEQAASIQEAIAVGDIVCTGTSNWPAFNVLAIVDGKAWIKPVAGGPDGVVELHRCRRAS